MQYVARMVALIGVVWLLLGPCIFSPLLAQESAVPPVKLDTLRGLPVNSRPAQDDAPQDGLAGIERDLMARNQPLILRTEAFAGDPFGVAKVTYRLRRGDEMVERVGAALLTDSENRIFYPVISRSQVKTFIQNLTGQRSGEPDDAQTFWFLFTGDTPLNLKLSGTDDVVFQVEVETPRPRQFQRRARQWWKNFNRAINFQIEASDYPTLFETYLVSLIGRRLGLEVTGPAKRNPDQLMQTFELMFDVESLRNETIRNSMLNGVVQQDSDQPLPPAIRWSPVIVENLPENIPIEAIAHCVPEECFYLRFGTWENQIWIQRLLEEYGGDLSRMIQVRGFKKRIQSKFLDQLAIRSTEFDKLFGGNLINDVAVIGSDTYFENGSAVGVILHAKRTEMLGNNLRKKRISFAEENKESGVTIVPIQVGDDTIEFLSSPDNRYRSFYAVSGDCHLMSTSLVIAKRFLEAGAGNGSLAQSDEFRFVRNNMPLERADTIFVYLSTKFFQGLLTPQFQIELRRRNRIVTDMTLLEMARMAAVNEGRGELGVEEMVALGYLPDGFGARPDGGSFRTVGDHWHDDIRGRRGFFVPIPDLPLSGITLEEADWFRKRATFFSQTIRSLDPMLIAIKRYDHGNRIERVVFDARLAPFGEEKYGWLMSMLGPPLKHEIGVTPNDLIRLQISMKAGTVGQEVGQHQIFAAVQDQLDPMVDLKPKSMLQTIRMMREAPGYIGTWPAAGYTSWMPALRGTPDELGYTYSSFLKLWKLHWMGFAVLGFDQQRLESLKPHLKVVESERPAQVRLQVGDLANSNLRGWANSVNYDRSWQTSIANVRLLNMLTQQFRVPPENARVTVERMLNVDLVCSLGGEYKLGQLPSGRTVWYSTVWPSFSNPEIPPGHVAPFLKWFRGLEIEATKTPTQFSMHGFLDIQRDASSSALPSFDLFNGFGNMFGSSEKKENNPDEKPK